MALKYHGTDPNTDWLPGIPARDLTGADLKELGLKEADINGRLYGKNEPKPKKPRATRPTESTPAATNEEAE